MQEVRSDRALLVVGLGNPGRRYAATRHNVGFRVVEELRRRWGLGTGQEAFGGQVNVARPERPKAGTRRVILLAPQTFMNCSGWPVSRTAGFYKVPPEDMLVVLDDLALPPGHLRAKPEGSAGGHNGLADVIRALGTDAVPRLRVGIGSPPPEVDATDYVLSGFGPEETEAIERAIRLAADAVEDWVFNGLTYVMEKYNRRDQHLRAD